MAEKELKTKWTADFSEITMPLEEIRTTTAELEVDVIDLNIHSGQVFSETDNMVKEKKEDLRDLRRTAQTTASQVKTIVAVAMGIIGTMVNVFRAVVTLFGESLDPIFELVLSIVTTVLTTLLAAASALSSNPYTLALGIVVFGLAATFSVAADIARYQGQRDATTKFAAINSILGEISF